MDLLLAPPFAFVIYLVLVAILSGVGRVLAGASQPTRMKASTYASGEAASTRAALPGYRPFFVIALFFAVLHLGVLMLGTSGCDLSACGGINGATTGDLSLIAGLYLIGLMLTLLVFILG